jgi:hypothetical protein
VILTQLPRTVHAGDPFGQTVVLGAPGHAGTLVPACWQVFGACTYYTVRTA